ncbi:MAG: neutral/alkaline non-lysosomal ceramidase N-terminal domain-containing protein [Candidatus Omnitrophica bacterium]|nr:neutral/alkaline non-lysosomal ceramidase N-terminal domain-containing protein [Candidatus Omnitrophota bacterium]
MRAARGLMWVLLLVLGWGRPASSAQSPVTAGAAKELFALPAQVPLAGYSRRKGKPSQGVHDPVGVRALVLEQGDTAVALVSADLLIVDEVLFEAVRRRLTALGFPQRLVLVLAATHTHSGPGGYGAKFFEKLSMGHFDPAVFEAIVEATARAIQRAHAARQPAEFGCATASMPGLVRNRMTPGGPMDDELAVCAAQRGGRPLAVLVNFAAHPTTLGSANRAVSADYPGVVAGELERRFPGAQVLFFAGAVGDQAPVGAGDGFERAVSVGRPLAEEARALVEHLQAEPPRRLSARQERLGLPPARVRLGRRVALPRWLSRRLVDDDATLSVVSIGPAVFFGAPCDLGAELGQRLKAAARARGATPFIAGFASDYIGYCLSEAASRSGEYEALMAFNGPAAGEQVVERLIAMLEEVESKAEAVEHSSLRVIHLSGTPYELGFQHGRQLRAEVQGAVGRVLGYFRRYLKVPVLSSVAAMWWLDAAWGPAAPFVPADYLEELRGLAEGSGVPLRDLQRLHAVPDRTYSCATFAAWGRATSGGRLIHLRNLDWNIRAGIQEYPVVFVVRPAGKRAFVNVGWAGFIGVLTGVNDAQLSVGQVGAETADATFRGLPMAFLLRRVLEEAQTLEAAAALIQRAPRTVGVNYVVADAKARRGVVLETTRRYCRIFEADDAAERGVGYARPMPDAVFRADTAVDPRIRERQFASKGNPSRPGLEPPAGSAYAVRYLGQAEGLRERFGRLDAEGAKTIARRVAPDSNVQSVIFAWPELWVANAQGLAPAAQNPYQLFELEQLFSTGPSGS